MAEHREESPGTSGAAADAAEFEGGDAACWLQYVCTECGALVEGSTATPCWRCGAVHDPSA